MLKLQNRSSASAAAVSLVAALLTGCPNGEGTDAANTDGGNTDMGSMAICQVFEQAVDDGRPGSDMDTCVRTPTLEAELCNVTGEDFCDDTLATGTSPNLGGCNLETAGLVSTGTVTMYGVVDLFGEANGTLGVMTTLYNVDDVGGTPVAGPFEANTPCTIPEDPRDAPTGAECPNGSWCLMIPAGAFCGAAEDPSEQSNFPVGTGPSNSFLAYYEVTGIPADIPLVALQIQGNASDPLVDSYQYDVFVTDDGSGLAEKKLNIITFASYTVIPTTTPVGSIPAGHGIVAGTINDCDDLRIANATIGFSTNPGHIAYFNGVFEDPTPEPGRTVGTNLDGIYAGLDLNPGITRVHARALVGGTVVDVGGYDVEVFPDSVTLLTLRGRSYTP